MKTGILERVLTRRHGNPTIGIRDGLIARCWNTDKPDDESVLFVGNKWSGTLGLRFASLREIYGDAFGGTLIKNALKAAVLLPWQLFSVWNIDDLRSQPQIQHAYTMDPAIDYFMEEYNILYYGVKRGHLYVFDVETDELDLLGPVESALETIMDELEAARRAASFSF